MRASSCCGGMNPQRCEPHSHTCLPWLSPHRWPVKSASDFSQGGGGDAAPHLGARHGIHVGDQLPQPLLLLLCHRALGVVICSEPAGWGGEEDAPERKSENSIYDGACCWSPCVGASTPVPWLYSLDLSCSPSTTLPPSSLPSFNPLWNGYLCVLACVCYRFGSGCGW